MIFNLNDPLVPPDTANNMAPIDDIIYNTLL